MRLFYTDVFVLPLPAGHRFPMEKYSRLREALLASGEFSPADFHLPHAATDEELARAGVSADMVRLSVGIEDVDDILWDIDQALGQARR